MRCWKSATVRWLWCVTAGLAALGCGGDDGGAAEGSHGDPEQDYVTFDVSWKTDAVILDDVASVRAGLVRVDTGAGEIEFDREFDRLAELEPGKSALLGGVGVFTVLERSDGDAPSLVRVAPAPLTAVIEQGRMAWRKTFMSADSKTRVGIGVGADEGELLGSIQQPVASFVDGNLSYSGNIGSYQVEFALTPTDAGALDLSMSTTKQTENGSANATITGTLDGMVNEAAISVLAGEVHALEMEFSEVHGEAHVSAGALNLKGEAKLEMPVSMALPFFVGPIPMRVELGAKLEFTSTLQAETSALVRGSVRFDGDAGVRLVDGRPEYYSSFRAADVTFESSEHTGTVEAGFDALLTFPELKVGVGVPSVTTGDAFLKFQAEALSNYSVEVDLVGGIPIVTGDCSAGKVNFGATAGASVEFLGITLANAERPLFARIGREVRHGSQCD